MAKLKFKNGSDWIVFDNDDAIINIDKNPVEHSQGLRTNLLYRYEGTLYYWNGEKVIELASNKVEIINDVFDENVKELIDNNSFVIINMDNDSDNSGIVDPLLYIDNKLSDTSENPVQNKIIKKALDDKQDALEFTNTIAGDIDRKLIPNVGAVNDAFNALVIDILPEEYATKNELEEAIREYDIGINNYINGNLEDLAKYADETYATKENIGDISTALDEIEKIQEDLLDGDISVGTTAQKEFELIETITLEKEMLSVDRFTEPDGTPLNLVALYVDIAIKPSSKGKLQIITGKNSSFSNIMCYLSSGTTTINNTTSDIIARAMLRPVYGVWVSEGYFGAANSAYTRMIDNSQFVLNRVANTGNIKAIKLRLQDGAFAAGTIINIYGVRAK